MMAKSMQIRKFIGKIQQFLTSVIENGSRLRKLIKKKRENRCSGVAEKARSNSSIHSLSSSPCVIEAEVDL